jgi:Fic family protein
LPNQVQQGATFESRHHAKELFISKLDQQSHRIDGSALLRIGKAGRLKLIFAAGNGGKNAAELIAATGLSQANAPKHLKILTDSVVFARRKQGIYVFIPRPIHLFSSCAKLETNPS